MPNSFNPSTPVTPWISKKFLTLSSSDYTCRAAPLFLNVDELLKHHDDETDGYAEDGFIDPSRDDLSWLGRLP